MDRQLSHTLANLRADLGKPASWARKCANRVPLVHKITSAETVHAIEAILNRCFPDPNLLRKRSPLDKELSRRPAMYFFAGVLYPGGSVRNAFLFGPDIDMLLSGVGSPFDSGGILTKHCLATRGSKGVRIQYLRDHECDLSEFREYFALYLTKYFDSFDSYLAATPNSPIDDCDSVAEMSIFACAFEIRHEKVLNFPESTQVFISHTDRKLVERAVDAAGYIGSFPDIEYVSSPANQIRQSVRKAVI